MIKLQSMSLEEIYEYAQNMTNIDEQESLNALHYAAEKGHIPSQVLLGDIYSSGDISILQTTFEDWEDDTVVPDVYSDDPIFEQMTGGTNSGAIADVITEQLNDKWLNIIITDGDLSDLMHRDNINSLLENVFVISVDNSSYLDDVPNKIIINEEEEISSITQAILNMRGVI